MTVNTEPKTPFIVSALLAVGAWQACAITLALIGWVNTLGTGVAAVVLAVVFTHLSGRMGGVAGAFWAQAALAFSLCGKWMVIAWAIEKWSLNAVQICGLVWGITALGYPIFTQKMDRALMVCASAMALFFWVFEDHPSLALYMETAAVLLFVVAYVLFFVPNENVRPVAWGILPACAMPFVALLLGEVETSLPLNSLILGLGLVGVYFWRARKHFNVCLAVLILVLAYLTNVGVVMGVALLALAFSQNRLSLKIAGVAVFALSLVWLYYHMQTTLLVKSFYLWAAGMILLGVYFGQKRGMYAR